MVDKAAAQDDDDDGDDVDDANDDNWKVAPDQFNKSVRALAEALSSILPCHPLPLHYTMYTTLPTPPMPLYCAVHIAYCILYVHYTVYIKQQRTHLARHRSTQFAEESSR